MFAECSKFCRNLEGTGGAGSSNREKWFERLMLRGGRGELRWIAAVGSPPLLDDELPIGTLGAQMINLAAGPVDGNRVDAGRRA